MKIHSSTRIYNEEYFIEDFIEYYFNFDVDKIHFFDCGSKDNTLKIIKNKKKEYHKLGKIVDLVMTNVDLSHRSYLQLDEFCNYILKYVISTLESNN